MLQLLSMNALIHTENQNYQFGAELIAFNIRESLMSKTSVKNRALRNLNSDTIEFTIEFLVTGA